MLPSLQRLRRKLWLSRDRYAPKASERNQAVLHPMQLLRRAMNRNAQSPSPNRVKNRHRHGDAVTTPLVIRPSNGQHYPNQVSTIYYDSYEALVAPRHYRDYRYRNRDLVGPKPSDWFRT